MKKLYEEASVQDIADAIREKTGGAETYRIAQMGAAVRRAGRTTRQAARAFGDMFAAMGTALAACFSPALRGHVDGAKEREQKQADFSAAGNVFLPSTHEIIAGTQAEERQG